MSKRANNESEPASASKEKRCKTAAHELPAVGQLQLAGKTALVTGSSGGIGRAVALRFAAEGADVALNFPPADAAAREACEAMRAAIVAAGRRCVVCPGDVSLEKDASSVVAAAIAGLGHLDVLVNNAGIASGGSPVESMEVADFDRVMAVNFRSVFLCTKLVVPEMKKRGKGRIINTASQLAYKGVPGMCHYAASKGAMISFTRSVALELAKENITVNCVAPGSTKTPILDGLDEAMLSNIVASIPRGQIAVVDEISPSYVFLASDASAAFVGQCISPNGGDHFL